MRTVMSTAVMGLMAATSAAHAQTADGRRAGNGATSEAAQIQRLREGRYQLGQMERVLEGAVEHGASVIRDRLQAVMPADMLLTENARARGFRLDGYGVFFDVEVPDLGGTLTWSYLTLDQNALGLDSALQTLRTYVQANNDVNLQQALKRVELQVSPASRLGSTPATPVNGTAVPAADSMPAQPQARPKNDPVLANPDEAYRSEIRDALIDAMLEHSRGLAIAPNEFLTVAARRTDDRPRLGIDTDARTVVLSLKGADLMAFLGGQLTRDDARTRIEVRVF
ncbi:MAG: hypothetical protein U0Q11_20925 [Vicinamibacterales bacterium]